MIPAYRSEGSISVVLDEVFEHFPDAEAVVVVDASPDDVANVVRRYRQSHPGRDVRLLELRQNRGQHFALLKGFQVAKGELIASLDDDGQNPVVDYAALVTALVEDDLDCVYGRITTIRQPFHRRVVSGVNRRLSAYFMGNVTRIPISNVRVLRRDLARSLARFPSPYPFIDALIFRATRHIGWRPVTHRARVAGESGYTFWKLLHLGITHATIFSTVPLVSAAAALFSIASALAIFSGALVVASLHGGAAPSGWVSLMLITTGLFSALFLFLGLLSVYVGRVYIGLNSTSSVYEREESGGPDDAGAS